MLQADKPQIFTVTVRRYFAAARWSTRQGLRDFPILWQRFAAIYDGSHEQVSLMSAKHSASITVCSRTLLGFIARVQLQQSVNWHTQNVVEKKGQCVS